MGFITPVREFFISEKQQQNVTNVEIAKVSDIIFTIARQTELRSPNAAVEAAKTEESGKGFAVAAEQVKSLAIKIASATSDINQKIEKVQGDTKTAVSAIGEINEVINRINESQGKIASSMEDQAAYSDQMRDFAKEVVTKRRELNTNIANLEGMAEDTISSISTTLVRREGLPVLETSRTR